MSRPLANNYEFHQNEAQLGGVSCHFDTGMPRKPVFPAYFGWDVHYCIIHSNGETPTLRENLAFFYYWTQHVCLLTALSKSLNETDIHSSQKKRRDVAEYNQKPQT